MESDDDMYEDSDIEYDNEDDDLVGNDLDDSDDLPVKKDYYVVLSDDDIRRLMDDDISKICSVLSVSKIEASALLRWYKWSVSKVHEEWFADESKVREEVGLEIEKKVVQELNSVFCKICFEYYSFDGVLAAACGHPFCVVCWQGYIHNSISEGSGCLNLRCPEPSCKVAITPDMIDLLACDDDNKKYYGFLLRSYVEENRKIKWCPAPGCDFSVKFDDVGSENCEVVCGCSNYFCWKCTEEAHRPVDCGTVAKWMEKNKAESENTNWILAYTKPCPKCKRSIEKNEGCMHMTCRAPCHYHFCWLCLNSWDIHGYDPCNKYKSGNEDEKKKEMAKQRIEKYTHYYERWAANEKSRKKAMEYLRRMEEVNLKELSELQCIPETQLKFVVEAWKQIVECRRVLKWTYAYGFYLAEKEHTKRQFFEYLQGQAEAGLERLHHCAEKELEIYLDVEEGNSKSFDEFRIKLTGLTNVTRNYFENLVRALENGLEDVDSQGASGSMPTSSKKAAASSKRASWKNVGDARLVKTRTERLMNLMRIRTARLPINNNTTSSKNVLVEAGGRNINSSNNLVINGDNNPLRKSVNLLGNFKGLNDALAAKRNYTQLLQQTAGTNSTTGSNNLQLAGGSNLMGLKDALAAKRTYTQFLQQAAGANITTGSNNLQLAGGSKVINIGGGSVTNLANPLVAGSSNRTMSKTAHVGGSSSRRIGEVKKHRTSNAGESVIINLDDDDLGEAPPATGAPPTQTFIDDLGSWACDACTFLNASSTSTCLMCSEDASGSWECEICTFVNKKHVSTCQMCEHRR